MHIIQFKDIYGRYQASGLSITAFCINEGLPEWQFYYWQRKLRAQLPDKDGFIPLLINPSTVPDVGGDQAFAVASPREKATALQCEMVFPNGTTLRLKGVLDHTLIKDLLLLR